MDHAGAAVVAYEDEGYGFVVRNDAAQGFEDDEPGCAFVVGLEEGE